MDKLGRLVPVAALSLVLGCGDDPDLAGLEQGADATSGAELGETGDPDSGAEGSEAEAGSQDEDGDEDGAEAGDGDPEQCDPTAPVLAEREFLARNEATQNVTLTACEDHVWWIAAAQGVETTITIETSAAVEVAVSYPDAPGFTGALTTATLYESGKIEFESPRSGEFAVVVRAQNPAADPELSLDYSLAITCSNRCERETTRFPLALVHGWTGFENIGPIGYFYQVREDLEGLGYPVAIAVLDPYNSVEVRGEQLAGFVGASLTNRRARKLNLIGHSQGGIDSRYVASEAGAGYGDRIGALITVGTPHYGTPITDVALGLLPGAGEQALAFLLNFIGATQDQQSDAEASLYTLSETFMQEEFNVIYTDDPRVRYMSWSGETCVGGFGCDDAVDPLLLFSQQMIAGIAGPNDGLVPESSAVWGEWLGLIPADHIDEIGQVAGLTGPNYDHVAFFRDNARLLRDERF